MSYSSTQYQDTASVYCSSNYNSIYSVTCPSCCCYSDSYYYYPYCCSCGNDDNDWVFWLWFYIILYFLIFIFVTIAIVLVIQRVRKNRQLRIQGQYFPIGGNGQPIVNPAYVPNNLNYGATNEIIIVPTHNTQPIVPTQPIGAIHPIQTNSHNYQPPTQQSYSSNQPHLQRNPQLQNTQPQNPNYYQGNREQQNIQQTTRPFL